MNPPISQLNLTVHKLSATELKPKQEKAHTHTHTHTHARTRTHTRSHILHFLQDLTEY